MMIQPSQIPARAGTWRRALVAAAAAAGVLTALLWAPQIRAQQPNEDPLYEVRGVEVRVEAENAAKAKVEAIFEAQEKAFNRLLVRLLGSDANARLPEIDSGEIARSMAGMSIEKERTAPKLYMATFTIRFRREAIQQLLDANELKFTARQAETVLLLALYKIGSRAVLWESPNPWRDAWTSLGPENSLTPVLLPLGDLNDVSAISARDVLEGKAEKLEALKERYKVDYVLISVAEANGDKSGLRATLRGESPLGTLNWEETFTGPPGDIEAIAAVAAKRLLSAMEQQWRAEGPRTPASAAGVYTVAVPFSGLQEWQQIRDRIRATFGVNALEIKSLSARGAIVDITYDGELAQLNTALAGQGLILADNGEALVLYRE